MALTYTWKLIALNKTNSNDLLNVVVGTQWQCTGTDEEGYSGVFNGATPFKLSSVDPNNFVQWENLTEEIVLGWVQNTLNNGVPPGAMDHIESMIIKQIQAEKNPVEEVSGNSFPWVTE